MASASALASEKLRVVATYQVFAEAARQAGGSRVEVDALAGGNQDPHFVEAKPSYLVKLHKADALLLNGLELEVGFLPPLLNQSGNRRIQPGAPGYVDCSRFVTPIEVPSGGVDRSMGDVHPYGNPHYHLDPRNMARIVRGVAAAFAGIDPPGAQEYARNGEAAASAYLALDAELEKALAPLKGHPVVTYHSTFNYFFLRYGIQVLGYVEPKPGIRPGPASLAELERKMKEKRVRSLLSEPYMDLKIARRVAADTGARLVEVTSYPGGGPGTESYAGLLRNLTKALQEGNRG
jgi:zinc/manganese transport system substrate-binding protein